MFCVKVFVKKESPDNLGSMLFSVVHGALFCVAETM